MHRNLIFYYTQIKLYTNHLKPFFFSSSSRAIKIAQPSGNISFFFSVSFFYFSNKEKNLSLFCVLHFLHFVERRWCCRSCLDCSFLNKNFLLLLFFCCCRCCCSALLLSFTLTSFFIIVFFFTECRSLCTHFLCSFIVIFSSLLLILLLLLLQLLILSARAFIRLVCFSFFCTFCLIFLRLRFTFLKSLNALNARIYLSTYFCWYDFSIWRSSPCLLLLCSFVC